MIVIQRALRAIDAICFLGAVVASFAIAVLAVMLIVEVALTSFASWSQPWAVEYSGYLLAAALFSGSGWTLRQGGHIRVNALIGLLPSRARYLLDVAVSVFALGLLIYLSVAVANNAWRSFEFGSQSYFPTRTPLFYPQTLLAVSIWILTLAFVARLIRLAGGEEPEIGGPSMFGSQDKTS